MPDLSAETEAVVDQYVEAYNRKDFARMRELYDDDIEFVHQNRGIETHGGDETIKMFQSFADAYIPDRRYSAIRRRAAFGNRAVVELTWEATPIKTVPPTMVEGVPMTSQLCSLITVENGRIVQFHDYG